MNRRIRMGMVGGGPGAFIGGVHRVAARFDGQIELVCGAFSQDAAKNKSMAAELFLPEEKCYPDYKTMIETESKLPEGERMDFISITTPNNTHFDIAMAALDHGFHVVCEKPMTLSLEECKKMGMEKVLITCLVHNVASAGVIAKNGGVFERETSDGEHHLKRFWIDLR